MCGDPVGARQERGFGNVRFCMELTFIEDLGVELQLWTLSTVYLI